MDSVDTKQYFVYKIMNSTMKTKGEAEKLFDECMEESEKSQYPLEYLISLAIVRSQYPDYTEVSHYHSNH